MAERSALPVAPPANLRGGSSAAIAIGAVAAFAGVVGWIVPTVGAPVSAIVLGIAVRLAIRPDGPAKRVISFAGRYVLQAAIVVLGATLSLREVAGVGRASLPVMVTTLAAALVMAFLVGRALRVEPTLRTLIGVGTAVCGASAIAAVSGVIEAAEAEIAYAIATIVVFNVVAVMTYPEIGHLLGLSQHPFGLWAGTAINDTSSVVAAAYSYGHAAGNYAVVVKLTRTIMIVPIVLALAYHHALRSRGTAGVRVARIVPRFLIWFLAAVCLGSAGLADPGLRRLLGRLGVDLIVVALAAVGLSTPVSTIRRAGFRPLLLGFALWVVVGVTGLVVQGAWNT